MPEQVELGSGVRLPEQVELAPGVTVPEPGDGSVLRFDEQAVQDVRDFFGLLCFGQNQWAGRPFQLLPWEEEAIRLFYGVQVQDADGRWVRYRRFLYDELPKKNGKSEFAAGLGLYHLLYDGENRAQVGVFAADKNNADIIYQAAKYMVEHTCLGRPEGAPLAWAVDSRREIHTRLGGVLKVYSSDAETKHGYSFSAILIDELHAQKNRRLGGQERPASAGPQPRRPPGAALPGTAGGVWRRHGASRRRGEHPPVCGQFQGPGDPVRAEGYRAGHHRRGRRRLGHRQHGAAGYLPPGRGGDGPRRRVSGCAGRWRLSMALSEARLAGLLAYCRIEEADGWEREVLELLFDSAAGYLSAAGVAEPPEGSPRRAQYDLCVNYLVLDAYDRREALLNTGQAAENPVFRRMLNQLKLTRNEVT